MSDRVKLKLIDSAEFKLFTGSDADGFFQVILTKQDAAWPYRVCDFMEYGESHGADMIVEVDPNDLTFAKSVYRDGYIKHCHKDAFLRDYEPKVLIHSTTKESCQAILRDGCLKSWNILKKSGAVTEYRPIGAILGDPLNYSEYVMLSDGGAFVELVVSSKQKGYIETGLDVPYIAGARLYFDAEKIARDCLLVRDGAHLKVKDELPLDKYLIWTATPRTLNIPEKTTPRIFAEKADESLNSILAEDCGNL